MRTILRDAAIVVAISTVAALLANTLRSGGIPLVASQGYELFVPCPEPLGEVTGVGAQEAPLAASTLLIVDAREEVAFAAAHVPGARSIVFDYLDPVPDDTIRDVAGSGAAGVLVYGDGGEPDSGRELARELAGRGVRNVSFVEGGAPALRAAGRLPHEVSP